jgi:hypothetical protein
MSSASTVTTTDLLFIGAVLGTIGVSAVLLGGTKREWTGAVSKTTAGAPRPRYPFWRSAAATSLASVMLILLSLTEVDWLFGTRAAVVFESLKTNRLNQQDTKMLERGYYEELTNAQRISPELWELYQEEPPGWRGEELVRESPDDPLFRDLFPSVSTVFHGKPLTTNRWGMRDREYELLKPPGTCRIALIGASNSMGWGVEDHLTYENLVEDRLNREYAGAQPLTFEILNFSVGGSGPIHKLTTLEKKAFDFDPDVVLYATSHELRWVLRDMARFMSLGLELPYPELVRVAGEAGVTSGFQLRVLAERRLKPFAAEMVRSVYTHLSDECRRRGIPAFVVILPGEGGGQLHELALGEGLVPLDLQDAYSGVEDSQSLRVATWDDHPNELAQQLLAEELHTHLRPYLAERFMTYPVIPAEAGIQRVE